MAQHTKTRTEHDSMGALEVPADALWGAQTQRALHNFHISGEPMPLDFIHALLHVKAAAARANAKLGALDADIADAIMRACTELQEDADLQDHFPVDVFQTGSGTSTNMNANEVIATLASRHVAREVHPNDHVNCGQSSNDVIPTTLHVSAAIAVQQRLLPALVHLSEALATKAGETGGICKTGRTHLMDAMPVTFAQVLNGWRNQVQQNHTRLQTLQEDLHMLAQGGTAVGTGVNTHPSFAAEFAGCLSTALDIEFTPASDFFARIGSQDTVVALSGVLKTTAVTLMKISNDLRWMNSGPLAGLGEITLEALQPGSSIMPGKVNPVIPEAVAMAAAQVIGNDTAITVGGQSGNFELNVMLPMMARNLLHSLDLMSNAAIHLADKAIATFTVNPDTLTSALSRNPILATALNPRIGYEQAAEIAKAAYASGRPVLDVAAEMTSIPKRELQALLDPVKLSEPHRG